MNWLALVAGALYTALWVTPLSNSWALLAVVCMFVTMLAKL